MQQPPQPTANEVLQLHALWKAFFPKDRAVPNALDSRIHTAIMFKSFFADPSHHQSFLAHFDYSDKFLVIDMASFVEAMGFNDFRDTIISQPNEVLACIGLGLSLLAQQRHPYAMDQFVVRPRFINLQPDTSFGDIKSSKVGQLLSVHGYVVKASTVKPLVDKATFFCTKCGNDTTVTLEDGIFNPPTICPTHKCQNKYLDLDRRQVQTIPYQRIKLQELDDIFLEESTARIPRTFEIEARGDLVSQCKVGDIARVVGIVKTIQMDLPKTSRGIVSEGGLHQLFIVAESIQLTKAHGQTTNPESNSTDHNSSKPPQSNNNIREAGSSSLEHSASAGLHLSAMVSPHFSGTELSGIRLIALSGRCLALLTASMCPTIFGNELVKAGLLLALFGGTSQTTQNGTLTINNNTMRVRPDIHVLMVGDPGLGKSQLLRAAAAIASRSIMVTGNTATTAGLTVAISRDGRDTGIEAGALVLADRGTCCIDELDKMTCDSHALLEAMEQQSISIAKAGVVTSLKSRTSILAAANPASGHYNRRKSVCENLKLPTALLSRFDIVFILLDKPDESHDRLISEHIMNMHRLSGNQNQKRAKVPHSVENMIQGDSNDAPTTLSQRLRSACIDIADSELASLELLKAYVDYARRYVNPVLSRGAAKILQRLYLTMRSQASLGQSIPVTTRHLESLIRLAQARAKVDLREEVTESDANDVVDLLQESLLDAFTDDKGEVDFLNRKGGMSFSKQIKALIKTMSKESELKGSPIFTKNEIGEISLRLKIDRDIDSVIDVLRTECYLILKGPKLYQLQVSSS